MFVALLHRCNFGARLLEISGEGCYNRPKASMDTVAAPLPAYCTEADSATVAESRASLCRHHAEKARDLPMVTTVIDCRAMAEATGIQFN